MHIQHKRPSLYRILQVQSHCWTWKWTSLNLCFRARVFHMCFCLQVLILHNAKQTWGLFLLFPLPSSLSYLSHNSVRKPKANQQRQRSLCRMTSTTQHYRSREKNKQECWNQTGCWKQLQMVSHKRSYSFLFYHGAQIIKKLKKQLMKQLSLGREKKCEAESYCFPLSMKSSHKRFIAVCRDTLDTVRHQLCSMLDAAIIKKRPS